MRTRGPRFDNRSPSGWGKSRTDVADMWRLPVGRRIPIVARMLRKSRRKGLAAAAGQVRRTSGQQDQGYAIPCRIPGLLGRAVAQGHGAGQLRFQRQPLDEIIAHEGGALFRGPILLPMLPAKQFGGGRPDPHGFFHEIAFAILLVAHFSQAVKSAGFKEAAQKEIVLDGPPTPPRPPEFSEIFNVTRKRGGVWWGTGSQTPTRR